MKLETAIEYFGGQRKMATALDVHESLISRWKQLHDGNVPMQYIIRLKDMSHGELDLNMDDYR